MNRDSVRRRGKGVKPAMLWRSIRLPPDVVQYYESYPNPSKQMRDVLTAFAHKLIDQRDNEQVESEDGTNT